MFEEMCKLPREQKEYINVDDKALNKIEGYTNATGYGISTDKGMIVDDLSRNVLYKYIGFENGAKDNYTWLTGGYTRSKLKAWKDGRQSGYTDGYSRGFNEARNQMNKFRTDIMRELNAIDAKAKEVG